MIISIHTFFIFISTLDQFFEKSAILKLLIFSPIELKKPGNPISTIFSAAINSLTFSEIERREGF